ncbi:unnamed protein product [Protopolystoma xenopodis]|uniref:Uncharacterized protein n=1 Tax=Protopolystoma xenopodis TaxID=117903 RepID=A0A3S5CFI8_9PLAT|nr:unnamed protein product [Protopolystoma xenopodis]
MGLSDSGLQSGYPHCLVDPFQSVPVPVCTSLKALFLKALEARTLPLHWAERLSSHSHACRYLAFSSRILSLIKPMLSEQIVDAYL